MTLYLWTHWFWITSLALITVNCLLVKSYDPLINPNIDLNLNINNNNNNNNKKVLNIKDKYFDKREPLKFPIPVQINYNQQQQHQQQQQQQQQQPPNEQNEKIKQNWLNNNNNKNNNNNNNNDQLILSTTTLATTLKSTNTTSTTIASVNKKLTLDKQIMILDNENENGSTLLLPTITPISITSTNIPTITTSEASSDIKITNKFINQNLLTRLINLSTNQAINKTITTTTVIPINLINNNNNNNETMSTIIPNYEDNYNNNKSDIIEITTNRKGKLLTDNRRQFLTRQTESVSSNDIIDGDNGILSSEALSIEHSNNFLDPGLISAICLSVFGVFCLISMITIIFYRRKYINKPQALGEPDSSVYIDDSTIRDNSDEMYSLDNDSFLNSLEAMTIQNYWTDNVKHTKL